MEVILTYLLTFLSFVWAVLSILFGIPLIGSFLEVGFYIMIALFVYRLTPVRIRSKIKNRLRIMFGRWFFGKEFASQTVTRTVIKEVPVRRSLKSNIFLRVRWSVVGALLLAAIQNREWLLTFFGT